MQLNGAHRGEGERGLNTRKREGRLRGGCAGGGGGTHEMSVSLVHRKVGSCSASKRRGQKEAYREGGQGKHHDQHARQLAKAHPHPALGPQAVEHLALPPLCIVVALLLHAHHMPIRKKRKVTMLGVITGTSRPRGSLRLLP